MPGIAIAGLSFAMSIFANMKGDIYKGIIGVVAASADLVGMAILLSKFAPKELFINPAKYFAQSIYDDLKDSDLLCEKKVSEDKFYVSANPAQFANASKLFYKVQEVKEIKL